MIEEQTIRLAARTTAFTAVCEACLADDHCAESYLAARVSGTLRLDAARGSATCRRGHEIRVERAERAVALRSR
ncbi:MAG: hypothetical protein ABR521_12960 [Gaiellaceae bacterium]